MAREDEGIQRVGRAVAARRGELGMTQQDLADAAGIDLKTVYNIESGTRWPIAKTRVAVAEALRWPPDALSVLAEGSVPPGSGPTGIRVIDEAADEKELQPFIWQIEREVERAEIGHENGFEPSGEEIFGAGHEADAWNSPVWDRDTTIRMLATFRLFAFQNRGGQQGSRTGLTLARIPAGCT
jgi:transcriptional regulator with XRE-family HTH domain